ncbi:MAG: glycosyltransferase family 2 protein, partial [Gemmatimonadaceae bacterium]
LGAGAVIFIGGLGTAIVSVLMWERTGFAAFDTGASLRLVIAAVTLLILGAQAIMGSFLVSVLGLNRR